MLELRDAVSGVLAAPMGRREGEALAAFLLAWRQAWPASFAEAFGQDGPDLEVWACSRLDDDNRYLKLRRIALERLAPIL